jgi:nitrate reductase beta subunit
MQGEEARRFTLIVNTPNIPYTRTRRPQDRRRGGWVEKCPPRVENTNGTKNDRIPRGGHGVHLLVLIVFFMEPAVGIEPTTC